MSLPHITGVTGMHTILDSFFNVGAVDSNSGKAAWILSALTQRAIFPALCVHMCLSTGMCKLVLPFPYLVSVWLVNCSLVCCVLQASPRRSLPEVLQPLPPILPWEMTVSGIWCSNSSHGTLEDGVFTMKPFLCDPPFLPFFLFWRQGLIRPKLSLNALYTTDALELLSAGLTDLYHQALLV